jgi:hypothetical protein
MEKNMKEYRTNGLELLRYSMTAFNGSGYADKEGGAVKFLERYKLYLEYKNRKEILKVIQDYPFEAMELANEAITWMEPGRKPSSKRLQKFEDFIKSK